MVDKDGEKEVVKRVNGKEGYEERERERRLWLSLS
jgi:hypothetical protein